MWLGCVAVLCAAAGADTAAADFAGAQWLRDPRFERAKPADLLRREGDRTPRLRGPRNVHTLFRKEFDLDAAPSRALLYATADDVGRFYVNGELVAIGPPSGYSFAHPYHWLDITPFLRPGRNVAAAHVFYHGLINRVWCSGDNRAGFMARLALEFDGAPPSSIETDETWRCLALEAFPGERVTGYDTQFLEDIDLRAWPAGWLEAGFDDAAWTEPLAEAQDHTFVRAITPPLQVSRADPEGVRELEPGAYQYDFGAALVGHTRIAVRGPAGTKLTVRHADELDAAGRARFEMRANCTYEEFPVLSGGNDTIAFFDYKGFRYVEVIGAPAPPEVWVEVRHYPFNPARTRFAAESPLLDDIWRICRNGVVMGSQDGYLDCPTREKGQYLGDAVIASRAHWWLTADPNLTRKCLVDFMHSARVSPGLMAVAPGHVPQEIVEYSLQYPLMLERYALDSGDMPQLRACADAVFPGLFAFFAEYRNADGLLEGLDDDDPWVLIDWPKELRGGIDYDAVKNAPNAVVNGFYYGALRAAARIERMLGRDGAAYDASAGRVEAAFAAQLADPATGLFRDAPGVARSSLHSNAVPLYFGLSAGMGAAPMLDLIRRERLNCGVYIAAYVIEACFRAGDAQLGYDLLTGDDAHSWAEMLRHGATACMEAWGPDQKDNASWLHPWSSSPIYLIAEGVLGLAPAAPGWGVVRFAPPHIDGLPAIALDAPHRAGAIKVRYAPGRGYAIAAPPGIEVEVLPNGIEDIAVRNELNEEWAAAAAPGDAGGADDAAFLAAQGWTERVGGGVGVWVSVARQRLYLYEGGVRVWEAPIATAAAGTGSEQRSMKTPLGWHRVAEKIGAGAPWGQIFRARAPQGLWKPGDDLAEDLVLTRVLWLDGLEPGKNKGSSADGTVVDSKERCIYIHGTNGEAMIGTPSSHGCVRMRNDDVIAAFDRIPPETPVLITER